MIMKNRLPGWFRQDLPDDSAKEMRRLLSSGNIHTVCQEAKCPNINSCFKQRTAAFLILGDRCTRACSFCAIKKASRGEPVDRDEPFRIAASASRMGLDYAVITSVTRDDLIDGGSRIFIDTIARLRDSSPKIRIELLIPDFKGAREIIKAVVRAGPDAIGHDLQTVSRLYPDARPEADYKRSLQVLKLIKEFDPKMITKSSLLLGLGERTEEIVEAMGDLKTAGCDILVLGQYLRPSVAHYPVKEFITPEKFNELRGIAEEIGFRKVLSAPKARSSYQASLVYGELKLCMT